MSADIAKLEKILRMEAANNYKDQLVFRGLAAFVGNWVRESLKTSLDPAEARLIEQVSEQLIDYGQLTVLERAKAIQAVLDTTAEIGRGQKPASAAPPTPLTAARPRPEISANRPPASPARRLPPRVVDETGPTSPIEPLTVSLSQAVPGQKVAASNPNTTLHNPNTKTKTKTVTAADLQAPLTTVKGVGETYAKLLGFINLRTVHDALYYFPFRHEDFSSFKKINELMYNQTESVIAKVVDTKGIRTGGGKEIIEVIVEDATGRLSCFFFNRRLTYALKAGETMVFSGRVDMWSNNRICFKSPTFERADQELLNTGRLVPVYSTAGPLKVATLRKMIKTCVDTYAPVLPEHLPEPIRQRVELTSLSQAIHNYHLPANQAIKEVARRRLAFDEFFMVQLGVLLKRQQWREERPGVPIEIDRELLQAWFDALEFKVTRLDPETNEMISELHKLELTGAQLKAIDDILADLGKSKPMSRLLQGDVGSGKTVVGATGLLMAVANGFQGALMAPTQILAEQHFQGLRRLFDSFEASEAAQARGLKIRLELLTGNIKKKDALYQRIRNGEVDIVVGTSAVIQEVVAFNRLGLVIIDEQHRFGVIQRATLRGKGAASAANAERANPHLLVMTATPIPRTLNLTIYGDLDLSIMNEMPPGRLAIKTRWVKQSERQGAYNFIRKQISLGRQAFVICPLVEESEKIEAKAAIEEHLRLQTEVFPDLKVGLLHGRMKPVEKDLIMHQFRDRQYDILVATSVIEVGIDIPNASVILIEGADRFGLSQLHQFRGRVGRGQSQSYCLLMASEELSQDGRERLRAIETTSDGFVLAEIDLKMRGPGEFFGTRQSGVPDLRAAGVNDVELLETARHEASQLFAHDPDLRQPEHSLLHQKVSQLWSFEGDLS